jgi:hypothetical protein
MSTFQVSELLKISNNHLICFQALKAAKKWGSGNGNLMLGCSIWPMRSRNKIIAFQMQPIFNYTTK